MNPSSWFTLKLLFGVMASIFALLAALFTFFDSVKDKDQLKIQEWCGHKWYLIRTSRWRNLPEIIISEILSLKATFERIILIKIFNAKYFPLFLLAYLPLILVPILFQWGNKSILVICSSAFFGGVYIAMLYYKYYAEIIPVGFAVRILAILEYITFRFYFIRLILVCYAVFFIIVGPFLLVSATLMQNIFIASILMFLLLPAMCLFLIPVFSLLSDGSNYKFDLAFSISASFTVTCWALALGHIAEPNHYVPQTIQMFLSNVIFDSFTLLATIFLLGWSLECNSLSRIPKVIVLDILLAALFALSSLYFGLLMTDHQLSILQIFYVLAGYAPEGDKLQIGPYFWAMHTAFIPTLTYLLLILIFWFGKLVVIPIDKFLGIAKSHKQPLKITATLLTLVSVIFSSFAFACNELEKQSFELYNKEQGSLFKHRAEGGQIGTSVLHSGRTFCVSTGVFG